MSFLQFKSVNLHLNKYQQILKNISFEIKQGEFLIILGSNGSGKSSLLKLINQTYHPTSGNILFDQKPLKKYSHYEITHSIKMLSQTLDQVMIYEMTLFENFKLWQAHQKAIKLTRAQFEAHLQSFLPALSKKCDVAVHKLSGGERQVFALSLLFLEPPKLLLLDEHTSALDPRRAKMIMSLTNQKIQENHLTAVMVTHNLNDALMYGKKLIMLHQGEIKHIFDQKEKSKLTLDSLKALYQE